MSLEVAANHSSSTDKEEIDTNTRSRRIPKAFLLSKKQRCHALSYHVQTVVCDTIVRIYDLNQKFPLQMLRVRLHKQSSNETDHEFHLLNKRTRNSIICPTVHKQLQETCSKRVMFVNIFGGASDHSIPIPRNTSPDLLPVWGVMLAVCSGAVALLCRDERQQLKTCMLPCVKPEMLKLCQRGNIFASDCTYFCLRDRHPFAVVWICFLTGIHSTSATSSTFW